MFDDGRINCRQLQKNNIDCYLMTTNYNKRNSNDLKIVNDWKDLYEMINKMKKKKVY